MRIYNFTAALAFCILLFGGYSDLSGQQNIQKSVLGEKSTEPLMRIDNYKSLAEAVRQAGVAYGEDDEALFGQQSKLVAPDGASSDNLGRSVAISGNTAVVGAFQAKIGTNTNQGAVYVFVRNTANVWSFQQKLTASDGGVNDYFGLSVAIADIPTPAQTVIMVGAYGNDANGQANRGAVYAFARTNGSSTWSSQGKLTATDGVANDTFGWSVAMTSNFLIIGAHNADTPGKTDVGAAYVFVRSGTSWIEEQKLTTPGGGGDLRHFGFSVAISGSLVAIGTNLTSSQTGWVYIFERITGGTWLYQTEFQSGGKLGYAVALSGETLIIGSPETTIGTNATQGMIKIFAKVGGTWTDQGNYTASDGAAGDSFGTGVAISGNTVVVGSDFNDVGGNANQGSTYIFTRSGTSWSEQQNLTASDGGEFEYLGISVAISGTTVVSGASFDDIGTNGEQGSAYIFTLAKSVPFDFDGDGRTDLGIFRPAPGEWWINRSSNSATSAFQFGQSSDRLAPADFTGDGKTDVAFWRPSTGNWFVLRSEDNSFYSFPFGVNGDVPVPADYDGDGKSDPAVFRPSTLTWYISKSSGGTDIFGFGAPGDKPVIADYDGDGKADIAIYRSNGSNSEWWIRRSSNSAVFALQFGISTDKAVMGDYTGDGKTDVAVFRPSNGSWFILRSEDLSFYSFPFGAVGDIPTPGDYDGDGKADAAIFRPSNSTWFVSKSGGGTLIQQFGISGDTPLPNTFVP